MRPRIAAFIAFIFFANIIAAAIHLGYEAHEFCAAHNQWTHDAQHSKPATEKHAAQLNTQQNSREHQHEHCDVLLQRDSQQALQASVEYGPLPLAKPSQPPYALQTFAPLGSTYSLAPKNSPPIA